MASNFTQQVQPFESWKLGLFCCCCFFSMLVSRLGAERVDSCLLNCTAKQKGLRTLLKWTHAHNRPWGDPAESRQTLTHTALLCVLAGTACLQVQRTSNRTLLCEKCFNKNTKAPSFYQTSSTTLSEISPTKPCDRSHFSTQYSPYRKLHHVDDETFT